MRFLLYNIRYGAGSEWRFHFPFPFSGYLRRTTGKVRQIGHFIKSYDPDIVGLVEVDNGSFRMDQCCQAEIIARELGHYHVYESKYASRSIWRQIPVVNKQGNALLTREKIYAHRFHYFKHGVKRLMIELELENFVIFLVHLSLHYRHRQAQLRDLSRMLASVQRPAIVAGDFNAFWGNRELGDFLEATGLQSANILRQPSHPSRSPQRELDFIFYTPGIVINNLEMPLIRLSDHVPLICDFDIMPS